MSADFGRWDDDYDEPGPDDGCEPDHDYDLDDGYEPGEPDWDFIEYQRWCSLSPLARFRERVRDFIRWQIANWRNRRSESSASPFGDQPPF